MKLAHVVALGAFLFLIAPSGCAVVIGLDSGNPLPGDAGLDPDPETGADGPEANGDSGCGDARCCVDLNEACKTNVDCCSNKCGAGKCAKP